MLGKPMRARIGTTIATLALGFSLAGCGDGITPPGPPPPPPPPPTLIVTVEPNLVNLAAGQSRQLRGSVRTPQGIVYPAILAWSSGDESVATVSGTGLVTAKKAGETAILAKVSVGQGVGLATVTVR